MDYLSEAKKFVQHAQEASNPEVIRSNIEMANWLLSKAMEEREEPPKLSERKNSA
jgi:hypothetical protein